MTKRYDDDPSKGVWTPDDSEATFGFGHEYAVRDAEGGVPGIPRKEDTLVLPGGDPTKLAPARRLLFRLEEAFMDGGSLELAEEVSNPKLMRCLLDAALGVAAIRQDFEDEGWKAVRLAQQELPILEASEVWRMLVGCVHPDGNRIWKGRLIALARMLERMRRRASKGSGRTMMSVGGGKFSASTSKLTPVPVWLKPKAPRDCDPDFEDDSGSVESFLMREGLKLGGGAFVRSGRQPTVVPSYLKPSSEVAGSVPWAKMHLVMPQEMVPSYQETRKKMRPQVYGLAARWPHRLKVDGMVYGYPRKVRSAAFLFDCSGSMGGVSAYIRLIAKVGIRATVAGYSSYRSAKDEGVLCVYAYQGKIASTESILMLRALHGCGNFVDGPALDWLAAQPSPRYWISDGGVTGVRDHPTDELSRYCTKVCNAARIYRLEDGQELLERLPWLA